MLALTDLAKLAPCTKGEYENVGDGSKTFKHPNHSRKIYIFTYPLKAPAFSDFPQPDFVALSQQPP